jgi:hypothetical protein
MEFSEGILPFSSAILGICDASAQIPTELVQSVELNCSSENSFNLLPLSLQLNHINLAKTLP